MNHEPERSEMHEYSIVQALFEQIEHQAAIHQARSVERVVVRIGELSGVEAALLQTAYLTFRERTICARAPLEIAAVAARWVCRNCGATLPRGRVLRCESCGGAGRLAQGDEILLERIEMEVA
ncbi:MAG TPA: hydrogenase maturation nickel metallochaperone HypA [Vicinamibacterales bacterium]|nr:hydrogenase maturation nickel metallochaperone HypA [Vicinamibacterales bacterium]